MMPHSDGPLVALLLALAVLSWPAPGLRAAKPPSRQQVSVSARWRATLVAAGLCAAVAVLAPAYWWLGVPAGALAAWWSLRQGVRVPARTVVRQRAELAAQLDLVAACLQSGLPIAGALAAVRESIKSVGAGDVVDAGESAGSGAMALDQTAALLAIGADPETAWRPATEHPDLASVAAAARRSASGGTTLAEAFREQAVLLRRQNAAAAQSTAGRAGVLMTAPLGACFLPAFLCLGLAPAVVGLLERLPL